MTVALLFGLVILLMVIGVPVAVSLGLSSILFLVLHSDGSLASIAQTLFSALRRALHAARHPVLHPGLDLHVDRRGGHGASSASPSL